MVHRVAIIVDKLVVNGEFDCRHCNNGKVDRFSYDAMAQLYDVHCKSCCRITYVRLIRKPARKHRPSRILAVTDRFTNTGDRMVTLQVNHAFPCRKCGVRGGIVEEINWSESTESYDATCTCGELHAYYVSQPLTNLHTPLQQ